MIANILDTDNNILLLLKGNVYATDCVWRYINFIQHGKVWPKAILTLNKNKSIRIT